MMMMIIMMMIDTIIMKGRQRRSLIMLVAALGGLSAAQSMAIATLRYPFGMMIIMMSIMMRMQ